MTTITITGTVTDSSGATFNFSTTANQTADALTATAVVTPGTPQNITVTAKSSAGLAITYSTPVSAGIVFTPVSGQPNQWTFVY